ncbi:Uncharacterised protein [Bordetella pertussis]|nr:Uncharacterised protein [Bordetella pertussis]
MAPGVPGAAAYLACLAASALCGLVPTALLALGLIALLARTPREQTP